MKLKRDASKSLALCSRAEFTSLGCSKTFGSSVQSRAVRSTDAVSSADAQDTKFKPSRWPLKLCRHWPSLSRQKSSTSTAKNTTCKPILAHFS